ncbi:MAG: serpin family protein, partial [Methanoregulaceae archaeon]|nr:serpin family protein [Methanoregulaceae archaeon]
ETLSAMGMPTAFSPDSDLSGMDGTRKLYLSDIIHKTFIDVNEEGTEAAASTIEIVRFTGIEKDVPPAFRADHPFIFFILDDETGAILFMGRVVDPDDRGL